MARKKRYKVFVSYSRHDEALVQPLAGLLGVAADEAVFLDIASIAPGDLWEKKILVAVKECSVFILCWCCEGANSDFICERNKHRASGQNEKACASAILLDGPSGESGGPSMDRFAWACRS
jgi:hypothetical protein